MKVFFQDRIVDAEKARVSVFDHGFLYGDGIYETVRAYDNRVFHWFSHFRRLKQSADRLELTCPWPSRYLLSGITRTLRANHRSNASVRITVSRGPGPLGLDPKLCPRPVLAMMLHPERKMEAVRKTGVSIGISRVRRNPPQCLDPRIKSTSTLNTLLAKMEGNKMGVFETVLLNLNGQLTEGTMSNIFFVKGRTLCTPASSCGLLEGVTRGAVISLAKQSGYQVREGRFRVANLRQADEIFLSSTTLEIVPVNRVRGPSISWSGQPGPVVRHLQELFQASVQKELDL